MDKFVVLACVEPTVYHRLYSHCKTLHYQNAFILPLEKVKLQHKTLNMVAYPMSVRNYLQTDVMKQPMKTKSYAESMDVLWNFLWDYFYPLEHILDSLTSGKQFVIIHVLDIQKHIDKVTHHVLQKLEEHNHVNVSSSSLVKFYIGDNRSNGDYSFNYISGKQDFEDMFSGIKDLMTSYIDSRVNVITDTNIHGKPFIYARLKDATSIYDAASNSWFEETLPKNQRGKEIYEQTESSVC